MEKGTIHSDMFLLKQEGKEGQGMRNVIVGGTITTIIQVIVFHMFIFFFVSLSSFLFLQRSGRGPE